MADFRGAALDRQVRWLSADGVGLDHLHLRGRGDGIVAEGLVIGARDRVPFGLRYRIACDDRWRVREARLELTGHDRGLHFLADGAGRWRDGDGQTLSTLDGCVDIDISATPFTNTLPIRRLSLAAGESRDIRVLYVRVPAMSGEAVEQRYACLETGRRYRYEGLFRGFVAEIEVDADGLVLDYPGLCRRLR